MSRFRTLTVWKDSMALAKQIMPVCDDLQDSRLFGMANQLLRSAISIPSNIAEGSGSGSPKNFARYLKIALGSTSEIRTQLELTSFMNHLSKDDFKQLDDLADQIAAKIYKLIQQLESGMNNK